VILVPFPFAELTATKARRAVVVSGRDMFSAEGKIVVAAITSNVKAHAGPTNLRLTGWRACGLLKPWVVTSWLATLAPDLVLMRIGALSGEELRSVESHLRAALEL
jgi:mRNA-degrading endonuclease toxin of MazEF toxin-antitoxin module